MIIKKIKKIDKIYLENSQYGGDTEYTLYVISFGFRIRVFVLGIINAYEVTDNPMHRLKLNEMLGFVSFLESDYKTAKLKRKYGVEVVEPRWFQRFPKIEVKNDKWGKR